MRWVSLVLIVLFFALQYKLWFGEGNIYQVRHLYQKVDTQRNKNEKLRERNQSMRSEIDNLKQSLDATEEIARSELGMVREQEIFYQVVDQTP